MKRDLYAEVTASVLKELEAGSAPWIKPWASTPGQNIPCNAITNRPYSGVNILLLWHAHDKGYPTPRFLTYKQAQEVGGNVRKGERGYPVTFVKRLQVPDKDDADETRSVSMMRLYTVFNVAQCDNLPERLLTAPVVKPINQSSRDVAVDEFIATTHADIREGAGEAYYRPGSDFISMPAFAAFKDASHFYATTFHELGHWTGHKSRLDRDLRSRFKDKSYAAEELVAELTSAFLCAEWNLNGDLRHAGYIASWIKLLQDDKRAFFTAASKAQAAADYLRGLALVE